MSNISVSYDYSKLSIEVLLTLYNNFKGFPSEKKKLVINTIVDKYFTTDTNFNLYSFLLNLSHISKNDLLEICLNALIRECNDDSHTILFDHRNDFISFVMRLVDNLNAKLEENDSSFDWDFLSIPKLIEALQDLDKYEINSVDIRQKINHFVETIKENSNKSVVRTEKELELKNKNSVVESVQSIPYLKLRKSELNKGKLESAFSCFELYKDDDKAYLVSYALKHKWRDLIHKIKSVVAFDFFKKNPQYGINIFEILENSFRMSPYASKGDGDSLIEWEELFGVNNFEGLVDKIRALYLSYNGATKTGFSAYMRRLVDAYFSRSNSFCDFSNEVFKYRFNEYCKTVKDVLKQFNIFIGVSLKEIVEKHDFLPLVRMESLPYIDNDNNLKEYISFLNLSISPLTYYWQLLTKYKHVIYEFDGTWLENQSIEFHTDDKEIQNACTTFIQLIDSIYFDGDVLADLYKNSNNYGIDGANIYRFIQRYFCANSKKISKNFVKSIWYNPENYKAFYYYIHRFGCETYQGTFNKIEEYNYLFYTVLRDEIDLSNMIDLKRVIEILPSNNGRLYSLFIDDFRLKCSDCYNMLVDYFGGDVLKDRDKSIYPNSLYSVIKAYYNIK